MEQLIDSRFKVESRIGVGGMGQVYLGLDTHTDQPVAIKLLKADALAHDPDAVTRFQREGEILRQLNHPNIVGVLAVVDDPDQPCIVMELVGGGSLADVIETLGPLPVERTIRIALELADALARAHHLHVIHRDIKPENVLLAKDGTPRLTDFGLAQRADMPALTATHAIVGTLNYISPEVLNGQALDARTDIWSFGVMLFEMLAGLHPFRGDTLSTTLKAILTEPPAPDLERLRPDIPEPLAALIYTMLEKDQSRRMDSMRRVAVFLEDIQNGKSPDVPTAVLAKQVPVPETPEQRHNLPEAATSFIGREAEIESLLADLAQPDCRLLSLVGPGGIGKTRLALEVAAHALDDFEHGVFAVELAAVHAADDIPGAIGRAVGFQFAGQGSGRTPRDEIVDYLRAKEMLLVLDNFEHLLDGVDIIDDMLTTAPGVKIVATSREVLNLDWEWIYTVRGMSVPQDADADDMDDYSAIRLFAARARRVQPRFSLHDERECAVHICRLVDGMPLGIELAASWLRMLTCQELATEIGASLDVLTSRQRTGPERHRSLRAVFDHSWGLLSTLEQETLMQLSVFPAPFRREAARAVAGVSLAVLSVLVDKSLLRVDGEGWYDLHPLLQQYAAENLNSQPEGAQAAHTRHSHYYLNFMADHTGRVYGADSPEALKEIEAELENVKAAFRWACQQGDSQRLEPALAPMDGYLYYHNRFQIPAKFWQPFFEAWQGPEDRVYITLLSMSIFAYFDSPDSQYSDRLFRKCLTLVRRLGDEPQAALAFRNLAWSATFLDRSLELQLTQEALRRFETLGQMWGTSLCHEQQARTALRDGKWDEADHHHQEYLIAANQTGCPYEIANAHRKYAWFLSQRGAVGAALENMEQARRVFKMVGEVNWLARTATMYGVILEKSGRSQEALVVAEQSLPIAAECGNRHTVSGLHNFLGLLHTKLGTYDVARRHLEAALALVEELGPYLGYVYGHNDSMGELELAVGNLEAAQNRFHFALAGYVKQGDVSPQVFMTNQFARLFARLGDLERSAELIGFATNHPTADSELHGHAEPLLEELRTALPEDVLNAALERGKARQLEDVVAELLEDFAP